MNNSKSQSGISRAVKGYFSQNWGILLGLLVLCVIFSIFGSNFLTTNNLLNLLRTCATNCYLAIGVQMAIILAGIDLTGGALAAFTGVMTVAAFEWWGMPVGVAVAMGVLFGLVIGFLNGAIVAYTGSPSLRGNAGHAVYLPWVPLIWWPTVSSCDRLRPGCFRRDRPGFYRTGASSGGVHDYLPDPGLLLPE